MNKNSNRVQYKDFSVWQNFYDISKQEEYWKREFAGEIARVDLKTDFLRPQIQSFRGDNVVAKVKEPLSSGVKNLALKHGATEFMVTLSVFILLLAKYSRQKDIIVGTTVSGRVHADTKGMLGMFVNTLVIKGEVSPDETFEHLILAVKEKCLQAYDNQEYQFEDLVEAVEKKRDLSRNPIFDFMFGLKEKKKPTEMQGLLGGKSAFIKRNVSKFDLSVLVECMPEGYEIDFEYCTDLFKQETIEYMARHYVTLLEEAITHPGKKLKDLHMLDLREQEKILVDFNATNVEYSREQTAVSLFENQVEKTAGNIALKFDDNKMTYAELNERANQLARTLRDLGVAPNDLVALVTERSMEMIVGILAIIKAGGAYVPINPEYPNNRIHYMLEDSSPKIVLTYKNKLPGKVEIPVLDLEDENNYANETDNLLHVNRSNDLVYCIYTSGTTGNPKGVLIEHRNVVNMWVTYQETFALSDKDTVLQFANISFDQAVGDIFPALCNGAALCIVPKHLTYDMEQLQKYIDRNNVTTASLTPKLIDGLCVDALPTLRLLESGGEAGSLESLKKWAERVEVLNTYGPTESTVNATSFRVNTDSTSISIGRPIANTKVYLLNEMELCGIGIPGELCIAGDGLARGYLNQPELTDKKFIKNPFGEGKLYRTGDLARWQPDGNIEYLGRIDEQVKVRGYRIELGEIESVLRKQSNIADAVVIVKEVGNDDILCAYLIAEKGQELSIPQIKEAVREEVTEYMIPAFMIQIDEFPITINGKLDKTRLLEPDMLESLNYVPPSNKTEQAIVDVFGEILGISPVGIEDSFFELGGHSLKVTAAINAIEKKTGIRLPVKDIFSSPTPVMLARKIEAAGEGEYSPIPQAEQREAYPASSTQKRLFILDQMEGNSTAYNMASALEVTGNLDLEKIQQAIDRLIKRHESLRTSFVMTEEGAYQVIADEVFYQVEYEETDSYSDADREQFVRPFDIGTAPLMRFKVVKERNQNNYILLFDMHHIISDHQTLNILIEDFSRLYNGEELQPLEIQYKDYSEWMRGRNLESQRNYWKEVFKEEAPVLDLVTDYPRPKIQSYKGAQVSVQLSQEQKAGIQNINKQQGTTDYMTLLAVFMIELHKYSRQQDIVVGTPISGRVHQDTETIAGMFVNTLAMRGYPRAEKTFLEFLSEIKELALNAYENQEYPFEELVEEVEVRRDLSRNPLFDVMFTMQNNEEIHLTMGEAQVEMLGIPFIDAKFDLDLQATAYEEGYALDLVYCSDLFTETSAQVILEHFKVLLDRVIANPEMKLSELHMVSEVEQQRILTVLNNTHTEYAQHHTAVERFEKHAEQTPEKTVIEYETGVLRYGEVNRKANALAWELISLGIQPNDRVAIMTTLEAETIIGILGVLKSGAAYVPIDPATPKERIEHILNDAAPKVILTREKNLETEIPFISMNLEDLGEKEKNPERAVEKDDIAYVIYTSGTTGKPKGVAVTRGNLDHYLSYANKEYLKEACTTVLITSLSFDLSITSLYLPLISGGCLLLKGGDTEERLRAALKDNRVTFLKLTPSHLKMLETYADGVDVPNLEALIVGGEEFTTDTAWKTQKLLGDRVKIHNEYGPTETTVGCCDYVYSSEKDKGLSVGIGHPIANMQLYILNEMELCGVGVPGELCIAGDGVAKGYLNQPELTAEKFIDNPYGEGKLYRSGDLARWLPNGEMEYLGRIDEQVKIRGYRIELYEIESVLRNQPGISNAAVIALETRGGKSLCAYLVATDGTQQLDISKIRGGLRKELPDYMIPAFMMQIETIPLNQNGKLDRKALPEPDVLAGREYIAPRTKKEQAVVEVYEEILGVSPISIEDSFFELGGDSIKAIRVVSKLRQQGYELFVADLMNQQTARLICENMKVSKVSQVYEQGEVNGEIPLIPIQHEFFSKNHAVSGHFNQALMLKSKERFYVPYLKEAIAEVVKHHDVLRNVYHGQRQITLPIEKSKLYDWYENDYTNTEDVAKEIKCASNKIQASIDLAEGPLVKIGLFHTDSSDHLLICVHHLVIDGVSWRIILADLFTGYRQMQETGKITLPKKTASFKDWAEALTQYAESETLLDEAEYWGNIAKKSENTEALSIGTASGRYKTKVVGINSETTRKLLFEAGKTYGTEINDLLLASLAVAVNRWKNTKQITIEMEGHGREAIDKEIAIDRTVGWFTSVYYVVLKTGATVEETIIETKEALRQVPNHGLGYGVLKHLGNKEILSMSAEIMFNYLGALDNELDSYEGISMSEMSLGRNISEKNSEKTGLSLNGAILNGRLRFDLTYDMGLYAEEDVQAFVLAYERAITDVVETSLSKQGVVKTPSDYGIPDMSYRELKELAVTGEIEKIYGMTPLQEGILFHKLVDKSATSYVLQTVLNIHKNLNMENMRTSLDILAGKYEVLRTKILTDRAERPLQVVVRDRPIELREINVYSLEEKEVLKKADIARGFDLTEDSLLRLTVLRMGENQCTLLWTKHHIIMDGWCTSLLFRDFIKYYELINGGASRVQMEKLLEAEKKQILPYSEYIRWFEKQNKKEALMYWNRLLEDYNSVITVPPLGIENNQEAESRLEELAVSGETTKAIEKMASQLNVTVSTVVEAAWGLLLQKYNGSRDVVFGKVVSGRNANLLGIDQAVGLFINTIPSRITSKDGQTVSELLKGMQAQAIESMKYEYSSLTEMQSSSRIGNNLIQTLFVFENYYVDKSAYDRISGFNIELESEREEVNYDISMTAFIQGTLQLAVMYNSGKYALDEVRCLLVRMSTLLKIMAANPEMKLSDLNMVSEEEQQRILTAFNDTHTEYAQNHTVVELFETHTEQTPEKTVIEYETGVLSYGEVNRKANALAWELISLGVQPNDRVAIMTSLEVETIIGILGVLKSGASYVPIDPAFPKERIEHILNDAAPKVILTREKNLETEIPFISMNLEDLGEKEKNPERAVEKDDIAYVIYTSGTTGKPKGVAVTRGNLDHYLSYANKEYLKEACTTVLITSLSFDLSITSLYLPLISGGCLLLKGGDTEERLRAALKDNRVTFLKLTPSHLKMLETYADGVDVPNLEALIVGGEEFTTDTAWKTQKLLGDRVKIHNEYGPTETTVGCCDYVYSSEKDKGLSVGIGHPIANMQLYILNEMELCGVGVPGELCIAGDGVAKGYLNQPELTAEKFIDNPYGEGKLYRSGDLARWLPNGEMEYLGRIDEQVKIRGYRIELYEIESVLRNQPGISNAAVIALETRGGKSLCAYLVATDGTQQLDISKIRGGLRKELPDYMIPAFMMQIETIPLNQNGKLDRKALPEPDVLAGREYIAPRTKKEQAVVEVYEEILGVSPISIEDSFFELGGDSIKAIRVVSKLRQQGYELSVADLMNQQTARLICENIKEVARTSADVTYTDNNWLEDNRDSDLRIAIQKELNHYGNNYLKARCFSNCQLLAGQEVFLRQDTEAITNIISIESSARSVYLAIKKIISMHGALRTKLNQKMRYLEEYEYTDDWEIPIMKGSLGLLSVGNLQKIVNELDFLADGKLLSRFLICEIDENNCLVLSAIHHLVWDGFSQDLLQTMIYEALTNRFNTQKEYSYINYCKIIQNQVKSLEISGEQEMEIEKYLEVAKKASRLNSRRDSKIVTKIDIKLNDLQIQKFNEYPNETAMEFLSGLMYSDLFEKLPRIPFAIMEHNRNDLNKKMLGLSLNLDYLTFDINTKTQAQVLLALGKNSVDKRAITEKLLLISQKYGVDYMINLIPIINYQGILHKYASKDSILSEEISLETMVVDGEDLGVGMHFYTHNDILSARVSGITIEEELLKDVMKSI
ncbi:non-ribosomal peptide synthetase [Bacillus sp. RIT694]|uniref:non-ribosomal peptide synthetase n=4 Tax=Bacillus TaxID=1386 RepID=UPI0012AC6AAC|nr:non-ribosomal peptide synthetase [Bacillus sp. RIT694]MRS26516.1 amino acid adenylation domain-containing protein [Bacillus sp. RIT694]